MVILNRTNCLISAYKFGRVGFVICDLYNVVRLNWAACGTAWGVSEPCCLEPVRLQPCFGLKFVLQDHRAKTVANWIVFSCRQRAKRPCYVAFTNILTLAQIYTFTHTHIHIYTYTHIHICMHTHIHMCTYTHVHIFHKHTYTYTYTCTRIHIYTSTRIHISTYTH
jgi:hypothetical protein